VGNLSPRLGLPNLGLGIGLRAQHFPYLMQNPAEVDWFEIISENFMCNYGYARKVLAHLRSSHPVAMHGVSLSIGSTDPIDKEYLAHLKELADWLEPEWISDHLCWTGVANQNSHDLLPMPLMEDSLGHVAERVFRVQDFLKRPLVLENPSTYFQFKSSTMQEWEFLSALCERTGCGILLDVNNVFVSAHNHGFDPVQYVQEISHHHIVQLHIAGPSDCGDLLVDTHDQPVPAQVWALYRLAQELTGGVSTLLEWDDKIPSFPEVVSELNKAMTVLDGSVPDAAIGIHALKGAVSNPSHFQLERVDGH
jgi:uncharacterized protein